MHLFAGVAMIIDVGWRRLTEIDLDDSRPKAINEKNVFTISPESYSTDEGKNDPPPSASQPPPTG